MFSVTILQAINTSKDSLLATHRVLHMFTSFEQLVSLSGLLILHGTNGRGVPVLVSQTIVVEEAGRGRDCSWREVDVEVCRALSSGSVA